MSTESKDKTMMNMPPPEYPSGDKHSIPDYPPPAYSPGPLVSSGGKVLQVESGQMELGLKSANIFCQNCSYEVCHKSFLLNIIASTKCKTNHHYQFIRFLHE